MRLLKNFAVATALVSMAVAPVMAQASGASALSIRAATKGKKANQLAHTVVIGIIATVVIVGGAVLIAESGAPDSP